ncbi:hypothetical protein AX15_002570 [Amanita polypyramis BW_CC]|nr:hypothetical protein AX15_002570 [Amanita polypyramis BW_CC]
MLTMCWSWFFIFITLLLVQPSQALHNYQDIRSVIRSRELANARNLWLRALRSLAARSENKGASPGTIVAIVLVLFVSIVVAAAGAFIWYTRHKNDGLNKYGSLQTPRNISVWWSQLRHRTPPTDIEKGDASFQSRFVTLRSAGREKFGNPPPRVVLEEPPAPVLPHIPKYPSVIERLSSSRASMLFSGATARKSQSSRVLVPALPITYSLGRGGRQKKSATKSPSDHMKLWFGQSQNPFVPTPHEPPIDSRIPSPQDFDTSPISLTNSSATSLERDKKRPSPTAKISRLNFMRAERVRMLHMDLSQDFRRLNAPETPATTVHVVHLGDENVAKLRKPQTTKTAKNLRFLLPLSPRSPLRRVPPPSAASPAGGDGKSNLKPLLSASQEYLYSPGRKLPKTAYI